MAKLITQHAAVRADVDHIYQHIATHNAAAADRLIDAIQEAFQRLALFPKSGRSYRISTFKQIRVVQVPRFRSYLIFYKDTPQSVHVLYVLDGHRDLGAVLGSDQRK